MHHGVRLVHVRQVEGGRGGRAHLVRGLVVVHGGRVW